ncbi:MAG TPA: hypothetical protein VM097_08465 [Mycobacteriales bacterium]|nr:hypothetical protein [Mycobacteriales bacterium]
MPADRVPIATLAAPHDGVVTQAALVAEGYHHATAHDAAQRGLWQRLLPGIYLTSAHEPSLRQRCHAALLHAGPEGVITGRAGCDLRGIATPGAGDTEVCVVVPASAHPSAREFCHVSRARQMPDYQVLRREGGSELRVALPGRCVADAIRRASTLAAARAIGTTALRAPSVDWDSVAREVRPGPNAGHLLRVVRDVNDGVRSPAEADVHDVVRRAAIRGRLPAYLLNPELYLDGDLIGSPDVWFPGLGLGDEVDSREWHEGQDQLDATLLRHERFAAHGLALCHITPRRFGASPAAHVATLRTMVAAREALKVREPRGLVVLARGPLLPARIAWPQLSPRRWR